LYSLFYFIDFNQQNTSGMLILLIILTFVLTFTLVGFLLQVLNTEQAFIFSIKSQFYNLLIYQHNLMRLYLSLCLFLFTLVQSQHLNTHIQRRNDLKTLDEKTGPNVTLSAALQTISNDESLKSKLEEDQKALKRMILILSLVGGLGVIAISATIIIFTRMRAKSRRLKRQQQEQEEEEEEEEEERGESIIPSETSWNPSSGDEIGEIGDDIPPIAEPSAPPAIQDDNMTTRPRHILSMTSQTTPSAPTAKELDAVIDTRPTTSNHVHSNACNYCLMPELPPPAYTPSAPPHYALPDEPVTLQPAILSRISNSSESSSSSSSSSCSSPHATHTMSPRRHSLGG
jgi:hypothetical protein